jgi:hypothetical protein
MGRTRRKEKQSARTVQPKTFRVKGDKKRHRETREDFSRKQKYMRFAATRRWKMTMEGSRNKGQCSSVGPARSKGKLLPTGRKGFCHAFCVSECSACPSGLLTDIIHSCLLHLQPAAASSCFWLPCTWPLICSSPPLRSPLQLKVPRLQPVALVPDVPSRTCSALPPRRRCPAAATIPA